MQMARSLFRYHATLGHQFIPGLRARVDHEGGGYLLQTNAAGFRCRHEFVERRTPSLSRILLFGDSYTAGDGVSDRYRFGDVLEELLPGIEVYNFGLPGSGTDQQYLAWREFGSRIEHDLVVIAVLVENVRRVVARYRPFQTLEGDDLVLAKPYFTLDAEDRLTLHQVPVPRDPLEDPDRHREAVDRGGRFQWLREAINRLGPDVKDRMQRLTRYQPLPEYNHPENRDWRLLRAILKRWLDEIRVPAIVCPIPLYQYVEKTASAEAYRARFRSLHAPPRVRVHDPLPDFHRHTAAERRRFRFEHDCHLTPAAHRVLAESLAGCIGPLVERRAA